jgi:hypothetical protein
VKLTIQNTGWGSLYNPRPVYGYDTSTAVNWLVSNVTIQP